MSKERRKSLNYSLISLSESLSCPVKTGMHKLCYENNLKTSVSPPFLQRDDVRPQARKKTSTQTTMWRSLIQEQDVLGLKIMIKWDYFRETQAVPSSHVSLTVIVLWDDPPWQCHGVKMSFVELCFGGAARVAAAGDWDDAGHDTGRWREASHSIYIFQCFHIYSIQIFQCML